MPTIVSTIQMSPSQQSAAKANETQAFYELLAIMSGPKQAEVIIEAGLIRQKQQDEVRAAKALRVTCFCKRQLPMTEMCQCHYCHGYFCPECAEKHFGPEPV